MARVENIRLFDKSKRDIDHKSDYLITIDNSIQGVITSEFSVESSAQWEPIFNIPDSFAQVENMMNATGVSIFKSGIFTRKFYKGGSYLEFGIDFRVVDWDGGPKTDIIGITKQLIEYTAPVEPNVQHLGRAVELTKDYAKLVGKSGSDLLTGEKSGTEVSKTLYSDTSEMLKKVSNLGGQEIPVTIGHWWSGNLVIENVSAKYSRERTARGPLYADYSIKFSTREILSKTSISRGFKQLESRVSFGIGDQ